MGAHSDMLRSLTIHDKKEGSAITFIKEDSSIFFVEGDDPHVAATERIGVKRFTYPRGGVRVFLHGLLGRGNFRFVDEHGKEWSIQAASSEFSKLIRFCTAGTNPFQ